MLTKPIYKLSSDQEEQIPNLPDDYPYLCNYIEMDHYVDRAFPWHWHQVIEIVYVDSGLLELHTADIHEILRPGEAYFVNSNVLHDVRAKDKSPGCVFYAHKFEAPMIVEHPSGPLAQKYLFPLYQNPHIPAYVIRPDSPRRIQLISQMLDLVQLARQNFWGQEFEVRSQLWRLWCTLMEETRPLQEQPSPEAVPGSDRIKPMLQFIQENYAEKITLSQIAAAASVSPRECTRCFQRFLNTTPIGYLNDHRVRVAAPLLRQSTQSILSISETCGFSSASYFSKVFQDTMHCTPNEYRKQSRCPD